MILYQYCIWTNGICKTRHRHSSLFIEHALRCHERPNIKTPVIIIQNLETPLSCVNRCCSWASRIILLVLTLAKANKVLYHCRKEQKELPVNQLSMLLFAFVLLSKRYLRTREGAYTEKFHTLWLTLEVQPAILYSPLYGILLSNPLPPPPPRRSCSQEARLVCFWNEIRIYFALFSSIFLLSTRATHMRSN